MPRSLPRTEPENDDGEPIREAIQFRGRQTSVVLDDFGIRFSTTDKETPAGGFVMHEPLPVASEEAIREGEAPANAVAEPVAEELTHGELSNPLICYGVICEHPVDDPDDPEAICGEVFPSVKSLNGHLSSHYSGEDESNQRDGDSSDGGTETDTGDQ